MTQERRAYAKQRVSRLMGKKATVSSELSSLLGATLLTDEETKYIEVLRKQLASTNTALRRWNKELEQ